MKSSIQQRLERLKERFEEVGLLLSTPEVIGNSNKFRELSKEYSELEKVARPYQAYLDNIAAQENAKQLMQDQDPSMQELAEEEWKELRKDHERLDQELQLLLLPKDPNDSLNIFLEIRAGTGGDEAAIFVGDLFRMYSYYAESKAWQVEVISQSHGDHGGYKEIIARISGQNVYSHLKFESGAHRVQRVPQTESQGRIHTSACTVAILPEQDEIDAIDINPNDLKIDTYRASGAGGQHVNKTDSAIRITHLPTGLVVECQDERSQHKNRARAMSLLKARLLDAEQSKQKQAQAESRKLQVGSGDRSERIRTYNYPQGRVTDHRIELTLYKLPEIMEGDLESVIKPLMQEYQAELLAQIASE